jgi:hypothetical protein
MQEPYYARHIYIQGRKEAKHGTGRAQDEKEDKGLWFIPEEHPETFRKDYKENCTQVQVQGVRTHLPVKRHQVEEAGSATGIGEDND